MSKRSEGYHQQVIRGPLTVFRALLANVQFAMVQIAAIALVASVGVALKQLPDYALLSASDYTLEMGKLRAIYEPPLGRSPISSSGSASSASSQHLGSLRCFCCSPSQLLSARWTASRRFAR